MALSLTEPNVPSLVPPALVNVTVSPPLASRFPAASRAVSVNVSASPDATVLADALTSDCASDTAPGVTVIVGPVDVIAFPLIVAPIVRGVPAVVAVKIAVYVPFALSVVAEMKPSLVPAPVVKSTASPPEVSTLLWASRAVSVTVVLSPETSDDAAVVTVESASDTPPGCTLSVGRADVTGWPSIVAPIARGVPATLPMKRAAYVPSPLSVTAPIVPSLVPVPLVNNTVRPPVVSAFPAASRTVSVSVTLSPVSTIAADRLTVDCASDVGPGVTMSVGVADVTAAPSTVAPSVRAEPAVVAVSAALYVPSPLSAVAAIVPSLVPLPFVKSTVRPPVVSRLAAASRAVSVSVTAPPDATDAADTVTADCASESAPGVTVIVGLADVTAMPLIVAPNARGEPTFTARKVAVYVPSRLSVAAASVPSLDPAPFSNTTASPPAVRTFPSASRTVSVSVAELPDGTDGADAATVLSVGDIVPGVTVIMGDADMTVAPLIVAPIDRGEPTTVPVNVAL